MGAAGLERLTAFIGAEAAEELPAVNDNPSLAGGDERIESRRLRDAEASLDGEGTALDACCLAADKRQERRSSFYAGELILEPAVQLQDSVISR